MSNSLIIVCFLSLESPWPGTANILYLGNLRQSLCSLFKECASRGLGLRLGLTPLTPQLSWMNVLRRIRCDTVHINLCSPMSDGAIMALLLSCQCWYSSHLLSRCRSVCKVLLFSAIRSMLSLRTGFPSMERRSVVAVKRVSHDVFQDDLENWRQQEMSKNGRPLYMKEVLVVE